MTARPAVFSGNEMLPVSANALSPETFIPYRNELQDLFWNYRHRPVLYSERIVAALDGQPGRKLRYLYETDSLRSTGTFFTGSELAGRLTTHLTFEDVDLPLIIDPACGAGDLLVAAARKLPILDTLSSTLRFWGNQLAGIDVNSAFIDATRIRLGMLAVQRLGDDKELCNLDLASLLPNIRVGDGTAPWNLPRPATVIVVNPPFVHVAANAGCSWSQGKTSHAAIFLARCIEEARAGTNIAAILPDVLRTGSRYGAWRQHVESFSQHLDVDVVGQFDQFTDVDVFILNIEIGVPNGRRNWCTPEPTGGQVLRDLFNIHVGPVVPFRLNNKGPWRSYAHLECLPAWETVSDFSEHIRFDGRTFKPPFILVRRTSKASYKERCIGTLVTGAGELAVENHLLVLQPKDGKLKTCQKLLDRLKESSTSEWMNQRIRCRHLTVTAMGDLPWRGDE